MPVNILREALNDYVGAQSERLLQVRGGECIIDDQRNAVRLRDFGSLRYLKDAESGYQVSRTIATFGFCSITLFTSSTVRGIDEMGLMLNFSRVRKKLSVQP